MIQVTVPSICVVDGIVCVCVCGQAQVDEFEKKLTAVHTKGLENVENEELEAQGTEQSQTQLVKTPAPPRSTRKTRGKHIHLDSDFYVTSVEQYSDVPLFTSVILHLKDFELSSSSTSSM